jgi:predicted lactoylglutathione lyase
MVNKYSSTSLSPASQSQLLSSGARFLQPHSSAMTLARASSSVETVYVMLPAHTRFRDFTPKAVCDTSKAVEVLLNLKCESRDEVDNLVAKALAAGGSTYDKPEDLKLMYSHSFVDPDGHGGGFS